MPDARLVAAILAARTAATASRLTGRGGTTLPGALARRVDPAALHKIAAALPEGVALVAGTNGKTTTTRMLAAVLAADGRPPLHNRAGANLVSGITATALAGAALSGMARARIGLFETDEAAFARVAAETAPRLTLLHNLFRDQLDRYGELDTIAAGWRAALEQLPAGSIVLLNADDPAIAALGAGLAAQVRYFGIEDTRHATGVAAHIADSQFCRRCGAPYQYSARFYAHIGHYACPRCGHSRPAPEYRLEQLELHGADASLLRLTYPGGAFELRLPLPGLYNAANALAAVAAAHELGVAPRRVRATLEQFSAAFGRIERVDAAGRPLLLALIKNPVGASETVRMLTEGLGARGRGPGEGNIAPSRAALSSVEPLAPSSQFLAPGLHLLVLINDRHADGTDVSWLWDADFEQLAGRVAQATVGGTRAADMAVRLKYAGVEPERIDVVPHPGPALDAALAALPPGATLYALPTYTAMLELREELVQRGWARPFWQD
jgi:UDP-N-acetylmuramyl tripeptide synthase